MADYTKMTGGEVLEACGTDAAKWAAAFMQHRDKNGPDYVDESMMICWFANAIMNTHDIITGNGPVVLPDGSAFCVSAV